MKKSLAYLWMALTLLSGCDRKELDSVAVTQSDKPRPPVSASTPLVSNATTSVAYFPISTIALQCLVPRGEPNFSGPGALDIKDKRGAIDEFARLVKRPRNPQPLSESKTLFAWSNQKMGSVQSLDQLKPGTPLFETLVVYYNYVTGVLSTNRYRLGQGLYTLVWATKEIVTENKLNDYGLWMESKVFHNDGTIDEPNLGNLLRTYKTEVTDNARDLGEGNYQYHATQTDATTHETRTLVFDIRKDFRKVSEDRIAQVGGKVTMIHTEYEYSPNFCEGQIPATIKVIADNEQVEEATAVSFDRDLRKYVVRVRPIPAGSPEALDTFDLNLSE